MKSGLIDLGKGEVNKEMVYELELFSVKLSEYLDLPLNEYDKKLLNDSVC